MGNEVISFFGKLYQSFVLSLQQNGISVFPCCKKYCAFPTTNAERILADFVPAQVFGAYTTHPWRVSGRTYYVCFVVGFCSSLHALFLSGTRKLFCFHSAAKGSVSYMY